MNNFLSRDSSKVHNIISKIFILCFFAFNFLPFNSFSQNETDALRYSQTIYGGTARFVSMGGAFGALGGDLSVIATNPAGIAIFRSSELSATPSLFYNKSKTNYNGNEAVDYKYDFNFGNIGFVSTYKSDREENDWKSTSFGIGYSRTNSYDNNILIEGVNNNSSMIDYFANRAYGYKSNNLDSYMEGLAYNTWLIDTITGSPTQYKNLYANYGETQRKEITTSGSSGEYIFSLGSNYKHLLYLGASLSIHRLNYEESSTYSETAPGNILENLESFDYTQSISTTGTGYSFKMGAIVRPNDWIRIGASVLTPTFYTLEDNFHSRLESKFENDISYSDKSGESDFISNYELTTPIKAIGSVGFIIQKIALVCIEYEYTDYSTARLRDAKLDYSYNSENKAIQNSYQAVSNIKTGAEYSVSNFRIRGGFSYYTSPYKSTQLNKNATMMALSCGFGIKTNNSFLDFAFVHNTGSYYYYLYSMPSDAGIEPSKITSSSNQLLITLGYKF